MTADSLPTMGSPAPAADLTRAELAREQRHFDVAWEARERKRSNLKAASTAAGGPNKGVAAVRKAAGVEAEKLGDPDDAVAFGRFDVDGSSFYVGYHMISTDERDLLVINWKTRAAEPFYLATVTETLGVQLKRQFTTDRNTVLSFDDTLFADLAERVDRLTGPEQWGVDDAVLRDLESGRSGEMQDIVQTIHAAQYELVRSPLDRLLVVQGGPGTGKTAVALHRVSWLLFNHQRELTPADVLVVGPNPTFTRYIRSVLPGLGDAQVHHRDLRTLGPQTAVDVHEPPEVARIKGEVRMAVLLRNGLLQRVRFPERADYLDVGSEPGAPRFTQEEILAELPRHLERPTYNAGRASFRTFLAREAGLRARRGSTVSAVAVDNALERVWPSLTPQSFLRDLLGSRERLLSAAGEAFTAGDVNRLLRHPSDRLSDAPWSVSDVALLDEADELVNGKPSPYGHIVVDEAQDLSPMQLRSVARRSKDGSMTIVGDLAQSTGPWARDTWDDVVEHLRTDCEPEMAELLLGYRVPQQIFEFAAQLLPYAAPELTPPRVVRRGAAEPELVESHPADLAQDAVLAARAHAGNGRFVGIICPDHLRGSLVAELEKRDVTWGDVGAGQLDKAINLARPSESKGLEFDAVVVADPAGIVEEAERGHRMLYVALTRTTRYLTVVHTGKPMPIPTHGWFPDDVKARTVVRTVAEPPSAGVRIQSTQPRSAGIRDHDHPLTASELVRSPEGRPVADLREVVLRAAGASLADQIRASVTPEQWPALLEAIRHELGVGREDASSD